MFDVKITSSFIPSDHMRAIREAIEYSRNDVPQTLISILQENTDNAPPASANGTTGAVDTGNFRDSWEINHGAAGLVTITNDADGAGAIDGGRKAGSPMPPIDAISDWVGRHLDVDSNRQNAVAYVIARAIAERGLQPRFVVKRSLPEILNAASSAANIDIDKRYARIAMTVARPV